jgi:selenocysteine lyase/cysteine desulfurase
MQSATEVQQALQATTLNGKYPNGVNVSVSSAPSTRLDFEQRGLQHVLRASPHYYNTEDEVADFLRILREKLSI